MENGQLNLLRLHKKYHVFEKRYTLKYIHVNHMDIKKVTILKTIGRNAQGIKIPNNEYHHQKSNKPKTGMIIRKILKGTK